MVSGIIALDAGLNDKARGIPVGEMNFSGHAVAEAERRK
jgi:hypothetical protein